MGQTKNEVWHTETDPATIKALAGIADRFNREHPASPIEFQSVAWADLYRRLTVAMQTGNAPLLTQIEPFMAYYLYRRGQLQPLDDLYAALPSADIHPVVKDLQLFDGRRYGIATALGISYYSYRADILGADRDPKTWDGFLQLLAEAKERHPDLAPIALPGNDLHIVLMFSELLAANGGSLFDGRDRLKLNQPEILETLAYWKKLSDFVPGALKNSPYFENFVHYSSGRLLTLPCFFGRGTVQVERSGPPGKRNPESFAFFPHPVGPQGKQAYATLDAEAWVVLKDCPNPALAKDLLRFFYRTDNYLAFANSVPLHLTPIFRTVAASQEYASTPFVQKWRGYFDYQQHMLSTGRVLPIFMSSPDDRFQSSLFRLEGSRLISSMVQDVASGQSPEAAAAKAQLRAVKMLQDDVPAAPNPTTTVGNGQVGVLKLLLAVGVLAAAVGLIWRWRKR